MKPLVHILNSHEYHMIHHSEDIVHEGLWKQNFKFLVQCIQEVQDTFNDLPSGRFLEKLALCDNGFGRRPFENAYFDHYDEWKNE